MLDFNKTNIILASASPRRRELLGLLGMKNLTVIPADSEVEYPQEMVPGKAVEFIALNKAESVLNKLTCDSAGSVILAADTIVWQEGNVLGKPADTEDAKRMLLALSGKKHTVYTGIAIIYNGAVLNANAATDVWFRNITEAEIEDYVSTKEPMDKAGAYGAQGIAALFVERIDGEYYNVVGLPLCTLGSMFSQLGIPILG